VVPREVGLREKISSASEGISMEGVLRAIVGRSGCTSVSSFWDGKMGGDGVRAHTIYDGIFK
jgi:hypothetical protein